MLKTDYNKKFEKDYIEITDKYNEVIEENKQLKYEYRLLESKYTTKCNQLEKATTNFEENAKSKYQPLLDAKDEEISKLKSEIARLKGILNTDGTNSGISTSKTPLNKKKVVPNTRVKSDKHIGGQVGHKKHKLEKFKDEEVTEEVIHELDKCSYCGGELEEIGEIAKDELTFEIVVVKEEIKLKNIDANIAIRWYILKLIID